MSNANSGESLKSNFSIFTKIKAVLYGLFLLVIAPVESVKSYTSTKFRLPPGMATANFVLYN